MDKYRQNSSGFTLVELLVAMAVIAVVLVLGVPSIANMKRNSDLTTTTKDLVVALNLARAEAVRQGLDIDVNPLSGNWNNGWRVEQAGTAIRQFDSPPTGSGVALTTGAAPIRFAGLGNATAAACFDVTVSGSSAVRSVPVSLAGRVATCRASCTVVAGDPTKCE